MKAIPDDDNLQFSPQMHDWNLPAIDEGVDKFEKVFRALVVKALDEAIASCAKREIDVRVELVGSSLQLKVDWWFSDPAGSMKWSCDLADVLREQIKELVYDVPGQIRVDRARALAEYAALARQLRCLADSIDDALPETKNPAG